MRERSTVGSESRYIPSGEDVCDVVLLRVLLVMHKTQTNHVTQKTGSIKHAAKANYYQCSYTYFHIFIVSL